LLDYFYYAALTVSALYEGASGDEQAGWRELLTAHREQLREWAEQYLPTFADKHELVSAEVARIEGRDAEAMRLYEQAIQSARENGFIQNEGVAHEVAARFYAARGVESIADAYLRDARRCYSQWGAFGKVKQLDETYPRAHEKRLLTSTTPTIGTPVRQLDVETVVKASQALSNEIVLSKLIEKLMRIAVEHAGAERGLLILLRGDEPRIEAEATIGHGTVEVTVRQTIITPLDLPRSALQYVTRTQDRVVLDDASGWNLYSEDDYVQQRRPKSLLCLPIVKQNKLIGALYLENNLTPRAFTADRVALLEMLASQAAISLENARLYSDLQRSEAYLVQGQSISHTGSFGRNVVSGEIYWSEESYKIFEHDPSVKPTVESVVERIHPDDRDFVEQTIGRATDEKTGFDIEYRLQKADGSSKYLHVLARAIEAFSGGLEFVGTVTDVTAAKQAEETIRQSEAEFRQILDFTPHQVAVLRPDRTRIYSNRAMLDYLGFTLEEWQNCDPRRFVHADDFGRMMDRDHNKFLKGLSYEVELRLQGTDGRYRWFLVRYSPLRDEQGHITRWYLGGTDIEDRKQTEQRLRNENVALREEIDRASMYEEIVGTSPNLRAVLSRVSKVATTDSTVLITGETGTGKELIARAVHRRSQRSSRAFVSVNCAAVPRDLLASELFGHEKGAFTGAIQRRLGRFELAEGGTIFLDEIGELPAETQIALLRVLQEREFERVGGTGSIRTNVRLIAATNRDLQAAIDAGTFRSDLFYRLNVFPIEVPPLRERREDIPVLVEYFIDRYARKAGKSIRGVNKMSMDLLQSYPWPGNIRELQNVIERSVILCDSENFSVDESWLSRQPAAIQPKSQPELSRKLATREIEMIETALRESGGRVSGPSGAAGRLGIPGSTLDSKIRSLKIDKYRFKSGKPQRDQN
jgi:formate hydrogenlyase transcriptional activator